MFSFTWENRSADYDWGRLCRGRRGAAYCNKRWRCSPTDSPPAAEPLKPPIWKETINVRFLFVGVKHCNENPIYVFLYWELPDLGPNFHIHVYVSYLYISRIGPHISCSRIGRSMEGLYKSLTDRWMWKLELWSCNSFSGNICFHLGIGSLRCSVHILRV